MNPLHSRWVLHESSPYALLNVWAGGFAHALEYIACYREIYASQDWLGMIRVGGLFKFDWALGSVSIHLQPLSSLLLSFSRLTQFKIISQCNYRQCAWIQKKHINSEHGKLSFGIIQPSLLTPYKVILNYSSLVHKDWNLIFKSWASQASYGI